MGYHTNIYLTISTMNPVLVRHSTLKLRHLVCSPNAWCLHRLCEVIATISLYSYCCSKGSGFWHQYTLTQIVIEVQPRIV